MLPGNECTCTWPGAGTVPPPSTPCYFKGDLWCTYPEWTEDASAVRYYFIFSGKWGSWERKVIWTGLQVHSAQGGFAKLSFSNKTKVEGTGTFLFSQFPQNKLCYCDLEETWRNFERLRDWQGIADFLRVKVKVSVACIQNLWSGKSSMDLQLSEVCVLLGSIVRVPYSSRWASDEQIQEAL